MRFVSVSVVIYATELNSLHTFRRQQCNFRFNNKRYSFRFCEWVIDIVFKVKPRSSYHIMHCVHFSIEYSRSDQNKKTTMTRCVL